MMRTCLALLVTIGAGFWPAPVVAATRLVPSEHGTINAALDAYDKYAGLIDSVVAREMGTRPKPWWRFW